MDHFASIFLIFQKLGKCIDPNGACPFGRLYTALGIDSRDIEIRDLKQQLSPWTRDDSRGKARANANGRFSVKSACALFTLSPTLTLPGRCLGVFDTVGSFGLPEELALRSTEVRDIYGFPDRILGEHIEHAFQALALNEPRADFVSCDILGPLYMC